MSELADPVLDRGTTNKTAIKPVRIGFTGTRTGMTPQQKHRFVELIDSRTRTYSLVYFVHGGAIGADEQADELMIDILHRTYTDLEITVFPASEARWRYWRGMKYGVRHNVMPPEDPLVRNRMIVDRVDQMYATPAEMSEIIRSGTWATIRYTRQADKPLTIIFPDGSVREVLDSRDSESLR